MQKVPEAPSAIEEPTPSRLPWNFSKFGKVSVLKDIKPRAWHAAALEEEFPETMVFPLPKTETTLLTEKITHQENLVAPLPVALEEVAPQPTELRGPHGIYDRIRRLLQAGADRNLMNMQGKTAFDLTTNEKYTNYIANLWWLT